MISTKIPAALSRSEIRAGLVAVAPMALAVGILGVVWGAGAAEQGFTFLEGMTLSAIGFSGAMQFAALRIFEDGGTRLTVVATAAVLATRHLLMGASLVTYMTEHSRMRRAVFSFFMIDESYGLAMVRYLAGRGTATFFMTAGIALWTVWVVGTALGLLIGSAAAEDLQLEILFPLLFLALLLPLLRGRPELVAALVAAVTAVVGIEALPGSWYVIAAAFCGSLAGYVYEERTRAAPRAEL
ncbi:MAG TPA: AzlC family ABC transporter permease [Dehalococcoidia bacterium]|nr:AzlC family ABC transporter permease [Dehalococcoidia bacterium]